MAEAADEIEATYGHHKGLPIVEKTVEVRGMEGGFSRGASVQVGPEDVTADFFFAGKGRPKGERFDYLVADEKKGGWRLYVPTDGKPTAVRQVQIAKAATSASSSSSSSSAILDLHRGTF
jgi:hypothetical protein